MAKARDVQNWYTTMSGGSLGQVKIPLVWNSSTKNVYFNGAPSETAGSLTRVWHIVEIKGHEKKSHHTFCKLTAQVSPVYFALPGGADESGNVNPNEFTIIVLWYIPFEPGGEAPAPNTSAEKLIKYILGHEHGEQLVKAWESLPWALRFGFVAGLGTGGVKGLKLAAHLAKVKAKTNILEALELGESVAHKLHNVHSVYDIAHYLQESIAGNVGLLGGGGYPVMSTVLRGSFETPYNTQNTNNKFIQSSTFALSVKSTAFPDISVQVTRQVQPSDRGLCPVYPNGQPLPWESSRFGCPITTNPFSRNPPYLIARTTKEYTAGRADVKALIDDTDELDGLGEKIRQNDELQTGFPAEQALAKTPSCNAEGNTGNSRSTICWVFQDARP
jgi:hypothetical protein